MTHTLHRRQETRGRRHPRPPRPLHPRPHRGRGQLPSMPQPLHHHLHQHPYAHVIADCIQHTLE